MTVSPSRIVTTFPVPTTSLEYRAAKVLVDAADKRGDDVSIERTTFVIRRRMEQRRDTGRAA